MGKRAFVLGFLALSFSAAAVIAEPLPSARIWSVSPRSGRPQGGQAIRIAGTGFEAPIRVFFDFGGGKTIEAFIISSTYTSVDVITPWVEINAPAQSRNATVVLVNSAGTLREERLSGGNFLFSNETLTPAILAASPSSGPFTGGTRVTIFGDGFQAPVQVLFGSAEARVIYVQMNQIVVESPATQDLGPVAIRVLNINSQTSMTLENAFHYAPNVMIGSIDPRSGPDSGGTSVTIEGVGFDAPIVATFAGMSASVLRVTPTSMLVKTSANRVYGCTAVSGPVVVTNIATGAEATGPIFTYVPVKPVITRVEPRTVSPGDRVRVSVIGVERGRARFTIGPRAAGVFSVRTVDNADEYELVVPAFNFRSVPCPGNDAIRHTLPLLVDVTVTNSENACVTSASALAVAMRADPCARGDQ